MALALINNTSDDVKPVQIHGFGILSVDIQGKSIDVQAWKKPKMYQLLLFIVAAGGRHIARHEVCDAIWPDQDAGQASQNLEFILRSLRQVFQPHLPACLKANQLIQFQQGKISLNPSYCNMDIWKLDEAMKQAKQLSKNAEYQPLQIVEQRILSTIRGGFLAGESDLVHHHRHRWHTHLCNWIAAAVEYWRNKQQACHTHIMELLNVGEQIDPCSERLLCLRMQVLHHAGYSADAMRYYQVWSALLQQTHGLQPSSATQRLYRSITQQQGNNAMLG